MKFSLVLLLLVQLVASSLHDGFDLYPQIIRRVIKGQLGGYFKPEHPVPRLVQYVQTFATKAGKHVQLLPLLWHETKVTHVILASVHLHEQPGVIRLNDHAFDDDRYDRTWQEVQALKNHGVKVMAMLGGAAGGTYKHFNGSEEEVPHHVDSNVMQTYRLIHHSSTDTTIRLKNYFSSTDWTV